MIYLIILLIVMSFALSVYAQNRLDKHSKKRKYLKNISYFLIVIAVCLTMIF